MTNSSYNLTYGLSLYIFLRKNSAIRGVPTYSGNKKICEQDHDLVDALTLVERFSPTLFQLDDETRQLCEEKGKEVFLQLKEESKNWTVENFWKWQEDLLFKNF